MAHQSLSHRALSARAASFKVSSRTVAIASATATLATAGALQAFETEPMYEGRTQLLGILPDHVPSLQPPSAQRVALHPSLANANIAPPDLIHAVQAHVPQDSSMADSVTAKLKKQGLKITSDALLSRLQAHTSAEGWLELHYQGANPHQVQLVLEQVAQWYATQDMSCDIQACRDVPFIEAQVPILQQQQRQLEQKMVTVQQTLRKTVSSRLGPTAKGQQMEDYSSYLLTQQHQQIRHLAQVEASINKSLTELQDYQAQMNLNSVKVQAGFTLLRRIIPQYQEGLMAWQRGDRQLLAITLGGVGEWVME